MEKPASNNTTMLPSATTPKAPTDLENQTPSQEGTSENNPPPLENIPVCTRTPWPEAGKMSGNFFELRKDYLIPLNNNNNATATATIPKSPIKIEPKAHEQPTPSSTVAPKAEKCSLGPNFPICNLEEDWTVTTKNSSNSHNSPRCGTPDPKLPEAPEFPEIQVTDI